MARKGDITTEIIVERQQLEIIAEGVGGLELKLSELSEEIVKYAALHGLKQKIVDAAALGAGVSLTEKFEAMSEVFNRLLSGEWNKSRNDGEPRGGLLLEALCRLYPNKSREALREWLSGQDRKQQSKLRSTAKIASMIDQIRVERSNDLDGDALLAELDELED